ncbi:hypothetical protein BGX28_002107 [Mortierella sp. GBA30]|nr:hypothetical protein BGX28_002107 [Mortierella sp. GBA30]
MAKAALPPALSIKTIFTPTTFVCLLALTLCTPTSTTALPILASPASASSSSSSIPSSDRLHARQEADLRVDTTSTRSTDSPDIVSAPPSLSHGAPFRTVSRPITIKVDISSSSSSSPRNVDSSYALLIQRTEQQEQFLRQQELQTQEELARLQEEQDLLEKEEQDRDQQLDNEEESLLDQDPETVRRRQEESLGLWMTDSEYDAMSQGSNSSNEPDRSQFDLYADDFKEVHQVQGAVERRSDESVNSSSSQSRRSLTASLLSARRDQRLEQRQHIPSEEEMLEWPVVNQAQFEDRQDEVQDEYEDEQA